MTESKSQSIAPHPSCRQPQADGSYPLAYAAPIYSAAFSFSGYFTRGHLYSS